MSNDIIFGSGDDMSIDPLEPRIDVTQCVQSEVTRYAELEVAGRDFPLPVEEIRKLLREEDQFSVKINLNYRLQGWCSFHADEGNLVIDHLSILNEAYLPFIMQALFETITYTPKASTIKNPLVTVLWPLHETDRFVFQHLQAEGWKPNGVEPRHSFGYGSWWDSIKMQRQF